MVHDSRLTADGGVSWRPATPSRKSSAPDTARTTAHAHESLVHLPCGHAALVGGRIEYDSAANAGAATHTVPLWGANN